jgi:hypothetical protein
VSFVHILITADKLEESVQRWRDKSIHSPSDQKLNDSQFRIETVRGRNQARLFPEFSIPRQRKPVILAEPFQLQFSQRVSLTIKEINVLQNYCGDEICDALPFPGFGELVDPHQKQVKFLHRSHVLNSLLRVSEYVTIISCIVPEMMILVILKNAEKVMQICSIR